MRNKTRNILIMAVCLVAVIGALPVFASGAREYEFTSNALWYNAEDLVEASASVLPIEKTVVWEELSPSGEVVNSEEVVFFYSEVEGSVLLSDEGEHGEYIYGQELKVDFAGDFDAVMKRSYVNDGLFWTPFDDDVDDSDVKVVNTGIIETVDGTECSVFEYTLYRDSAQSGYDFKETIYDDYEDSESNVFIKYEGKAWIDGEGVLRQLESNLDRNGVSYTETVKYDYDGSVIYPVESVLEGTIGTTAGDMIVQTNFKSIESMSGYWTATDFYR